MGMAWRPKRKGVVSKQGTKKKIAGGWKRKSEEQQEEVENEEQNIRDSLSYYDDILTPEATDTAKQKPKRTRKMAFAAPELPLRVTRSSTKQG